MIEVGELITCKNCGTKFRWIPRSTIRPKYCLKCHNKRLLSHSNFYHKDNTEDKLSKYIIRQKNGLKRLKTPRERFYSYTAWKWFSKYILIINSIDITGTTTQCCTCGQWMSVNTKNCQVGHYIKVFDGNSSNYSTAFRETNVGPQCVQCNKNMGGRQDEMAVWIKNKFGQEALDELYKLKKIPLHLDDAYLQKIADEYKKKFYDYLKEHNLKNPWGK